MTTITQREAEQVEKANASGRPPVVFIHGLWLLPSSWQHWMDRFEEAGYAPLAPGWPDDPATVANFNPGAETKADTKNPERGPLLIFTGEDDHAVPPAMSRAAFKIQSRNPGTTEHVEMPNRGHSLTIDHGWREVAEKALDFVKRFGD